MFLNLINGPSPYDPRTGEDLPGVPFHQNLIRPKITKLKKDIIPLLEKMNDTELEKYLSGLDNKAIVELIREILKKADK